MSTLAELQFGYATNRIYMAAYREAKASLIGKD